MKRTWFDSVIDELRDDVEFLTEEMAFDCVNEVRRVMGEEGVSQAGLARRIGKSSAYVSKLLNYNPNMTLRSLVVIADALGHRWEAPHLIGKHAHSAWKPYLSQVVGVDTMRGSSLVQAAPSELWVIQKPRQKGAEINGQPCSLAA